MEKHVNDEQSIRQFLRATYGARTPNGEVAFEPYKGLDFEKLHAVGESKILNGKVRIRPWSLFSIDALPQKPVKPDRRFITSISHQRLDRRGRRGSADRISLFEATPIICIAHTLANQDTIFELVRPAGHRRTNCVDAQADNSRFSTTTSRSIIGTAYMVLVGYDAYCKASFDGTT